MDQRTLQYSEMQYSAVAADRYGEIALGVECAWPQLLGAPTAVPGLVSPSSSSPYRGPDVGSASFFRVAGVSLVALLLLAAALPADAAPYAPEEYDFSELSSVGADALGVVESVREVPLHASPAGLADVFEHSLRPETGDELVVRLDDGRLATVILSGTERFRPGERVRLLRDGRVLRT